MNQTVLPPLSLRHPVPDCGLPRMFTDTTDLAAHLRRFGPLPGDTGRLVDLVEAAGLRGRGGAGFPTARKLRAVGAGRGAKVAVANGTEGEPLSSKDKTLLARAPHLVLDGLTLAADALGAQRRIVCFEQGNPTVERALHRAYDERSDNRIELLATPRRYGAGQETALVDLIDGGMGKPTLRRPFDSGVGGRPTLVDNVETLAQVALIARFGAQWYRSLGTPAEPGSALFTVSGDLDRPALYEIPLGYPLGQLLNDAGAHNPRAVLLGGYFGRWLPGHVAQATRLDRASLGPLGADIGAGVIVVVDEGTCAVDEISRVAGWFAANSAGQCGACKWGLRDLAQAAEAVNAGRAGRSTLADMGRWSAMVRGRGACRLPDGAATFLDSALAVFADEVEEHRSGRCPRPSRHLLATPAPQGWA